MLSFLHTSHTHIPRFADLLADIDATVPAQHIVREDILAKIQQAGNLTPAIQSELNKIVAELKQNSTAVLCTCSTIGGLVESYTEENLPILRVDRPMAEKALTYGPNIAVLATFAPTLDPTCELIKSVATSSQIYELHPILCEGAWDDFSQGNLQGYYAKIAQSIAHIQSDAIVLAQASMVSNIDYQAYTTIPILSSPRLGVEAIVDAYHMHQEQKNPRQV